MSTSQHDQSLQSSPPSQRMPLRLHLADEAEGPLAGAWWPQSRDLQDEAADLVDHFPAEVGRINRLLYSRPDWDAAVVGRRGVHKIRAQRGPIKVGSFPSDDTHVMVLTLASGRRLKLAVIPSRLSPADGARRLEAAGADTGLDSDAHWARWDDESPVT